MLTFFKMISLSFVGSNTCKTQKNSVLTVSNKIKPTYYILKIPWKTVNISSPLYQWQPLAILTSPLVISKYFTMHLIFF